MKKMEHSIYHSSLRVAALTIATLLVFDSGIISSVTQQFSKNAQQHVASVIGIQARVEPTELNTYTAALTARTTELDAREATLAERELRTGVKNRNERGTENISTYILSMLLFVIIVLLVLNYILDFRRAGRLVPLQTNV